MMCTAYGGQPRQEDSISSQTATEIALNDGRWIRIGMDGIKCDSRFACKCNTMKALEYNCVALAEIVIPVNVSMVSF